MATNDKCTILSKKIKVINGVRYEQLLFIGHPPMNEGWLRMPLGTPVENGGYDLDGDVVYRPAAECEIIPLFG